jgi:hypothetical protein
LRLRAKGLNHAPLENEEKARSGEPLSVFSDDQTVPPASAIFAIVVLPGAARISEPLEECQTHNGISLKLQLRPTFYPEFPQYCFKVGQVNIRLRLYNRPLVSV